MNYLKENVLNILIYISAGLFYFVISLFFEKKLLDTFLKEDFLTVLIALLAVYIPTMTVLLSRIDVLRQNHPYFDPKHLLAELKVFIRELMFYIFIVLVVLIIYSSGSLGIKIGCIVFNMQYENIYLSILFAVLIANIKSFYDLCMTLILLYSEIITNDN